MNDMDQYEQEEAAKELAKIAAEDAAWKAKPEAERRRLTEEQLERLAQFEAAADEEE